MCKAEPGHYCKYSSELLSDEVRVKQTMNIGDEDGMTIKNVLPDSDIIVCTAGKLVNEIAKRQHGCFQ